MPFYLFVWSDEIETHLAANDISAAESFAVLIGWRPAEVQGGRLPSVQLPRGA